MNDITAHIVVPHDHPSLAGHFPGHPIVPGVVLLDEVSDAIRASCPAKIRLASIVSTKFLRAVTPGMRVDLQVKFAAEAAGGWKARFAGMHDGAPVLEGSFILTNHVEGDAP